MVANAREVWRSCRGGRRIEIKMTKRELAVVGGTLIDGNGGKPLADSIVHIVDNRFHAVGRAGEILVPTGVDVLDATGQFVLPGLMNGNVHLLDGIMMMGIGGTEYLARFEGCLFEVIEEAAQIALRGGVTTVFDTWNALVPVLKARDRINAGQTVGARIFAAGNIVGMGGPFSGDFVPQARKVISRTFADRIDNLFEAGVGRYLSTLPPDEVRSIIRDYIARGIDFLKFAVSDHLIGLLGWRSPYFTFSERVQRVIVDEARKAGIPLVTHTTSVESLNVAVELEADAMMHVTCTGQVPIPEELLQRMAKGRAWSGIQPTTRGYQCHLDSTNHPWAEYAGGVHDENTLRLIKARAPIILCTDAGCADPDVLHDLPPKELIDRPWSLGTDHISWFKAMVEKGMAPMDAILSATRNLASAYGKAEHYGTVEAGKVADLIVVAEDPLNEITNIAKLNVVVKDGERVDFKRLPLKPMVNDYPRDADSC
ncbi:MAG: amidohydrolase family protein [Proteobacteria bacterium]|nr:amidohydrolase family protein [Pseudomonadota bacterium]